MYLGNDRERDKRNRHPNGSPSGRSRFPRPEHTSASLGRSSDARSEETQRKRAAMERAANPKRPRQPNQRDNGIRRPSGSPSAKSQILVRSMSSVGSDATPTGSRPHPRPECARRPKPVSLARSDVTQRRATQRQESHPRPECARRPKPVSRARSDVAQRQRAARRASGKPKEHLRGTKGFAGPDGWHVVEFPHPEHEPYETEAAIASTRSEPRRR